MTAPANVKKFYTFTPNSFQKYGAPRDNGTRKHRGTDLAHGYGTLVPMLLGGVILGKLAPSPSHGFGYQTMTKVVFGGRTYRVSYSHGTKASPLTTGKTYPAGTYIQAEGTTGAAVGACVHVEVYDVAAGKFIDPMILIKKVLANPAPASLHPPTVRYGNRGATVKKLQKVLVGRGHKIAIDGVYGNATRTAVQKVQAAGKKKKRITKVTGVCGPQTWAYLGY